MRPGARLAKTKVVRAKILGGEGQNLGGEGKYLSGEAWPPVVATVGEGLGLYFEHLSTKNQ